ncbi:hypothetical protein D3C72_1570070 [compost metagenome]
MPAPLLRSPGFTLTMAPRLLSSPLSAMYSSRPALSTSSPGPAMWKLLLRMSRPASTTDTSSAWRCTIRLPRAEAAFSVCGCGGSSGRPGKSRPRQPAPSDGTRSTSPSAVPAPTMSRPARIATGPAPSYQSPFGVATPVLEPR